ncbi:MAG: folate-binding protein YgfZ [Methylococcaceae bacterium]|nr:folate-binding protein YgfZ [Methylococcaceae bacterium]
MNQSWKKFLLGENASFENNQIVFPTVDLENHNRIYAVSNLSVLTVSGRDAVTFLQGQTTCNVNDISETKSGLGAFCTAKGRVITTFLLAKHNGDFLLVLPAELLAIIKKRLQMYILRADVVLTDSSDDICLLGLLCPDDQTGSIAVPDPLFTSYPQQDVLNQIALPQNRYLILAKPSKAISLWSEKVGSQHYRPDNSAHWSYLDIIDGIPWLTALTSEEFIPQMLNLDKLGGVSFNKGCYTGQEIVARTHYLGKSKREMRLAEGVMTLPPEPNTAIFDDDAGTEEVVGRVLQGLIHKNCCKMLIVIQVYDEKPHGLKLKNPDQNKITLI